MEENVTKLRKQLEFSDSKHDPNEVPDRNQSPL